MLGQEPGERGEVVRLELLELQAAKAQAACVRGDSLGDGPLELTNRGRVDAVDRPQPRAEQLGDRMQRLLEDRRAGTGCGLIRLRAQQSLVEQEGSYLPGWIAESERGDNVGGPRIPADSRRNPSPRRPLV